MKISSTNVLPGDSRKNSDTVNRKKYAITTINGII